MNKLLTYLNTFLLVVVLVVVLLSGGQGGAGGTTNYQSLDLQPEVAGDNALVVRNNSGTAQLTITGAGVATFANTVTITGESDFSRIRQGGTVLTGLLATSTLTAAQVCDNVVARLDAGWAAGHPTATTTLPSANSVFSDCLTANGDSVDFLFENAAATSASTTIIIAGASTTLVGPGTGDDLINGLNWARLKFTRQSDSVMVVETEELTDAD